MYPRPSVWPSRPSVALVDDVAGVAGLFTGECAIMLAPARVFTSLVLPSRGLHRRRGTWSLPWRREPDVLRALSVLELQPEARLPPLAAVPLPLPPPPPPHPYKPEPSHLLAVSAPPPTAMPSLPPATQAPPLAVELSFL